MNRTKDADIAKICDLLYKGNQRFLWNLESCTDDCRNWLQMLREDYPIPSKNIAVFSSKENFEKIAVKKLWDTESEQHKSWMTIPHGG